MSVHRNLSKINDWFGNYIIGDQILTIYLFLDKCVIHIFYFYLLVKCLMQNSQEK